MIEEECRSQTAAPDLGSLYLAASISLLLFLCVPPHDCLPSWGSSLSAGPAGGKLWQSSQPIVRLELAVWQPVTLQVWPYALIITDIVWGGPCLDGTQLVKPSLGLDREYRQWLTYGVRASSSWLPESDERKPPLVYSQSPSFYVICLSVLQSHLQFILPYCHSTTCSRYLPLSRSHLLFPLGFYMLSPMLILLSPLFYFHASMPVQAFPPLWNFPCSPLLQGSPSCELQSKGNIAWQRLSRVPRGFGVVEGRKGSFLIFLSPLPTEGLASNWQDGRRSMRMVPWAALSQQNRLRLEASLWFFVHF